MKRRSRGFLSAVLTIAFALGAGAANAADVPVEYLVETRAFNAAVSAGEELVFELHADRTCSGAFHAETILVGDARLYPQKVQAQRVALAPSPPKAIALRAVLTPAQARNEMFVMVTGNGIVPVGGACQPLPPSPPAVAGSSPVPAGVIVMWAGSPAAIPAGWALCDGTAGTPDLRDRFIFGTASGETPGATGGASSHSHAVQAHSHTVDPATAATTSAGAHTHTLSLNLSTANGFACTSATGCVNGGPFAFNGHSHSGAALSAGAHTHSLDIPATATDSAAPPTDAQDHLPPFYKLAFIMKL